MQNPHLLNRSHHNWDLLIFTQTWPNTLCSIWISKNPNHTCNFPPQKNLWTVRGIWFVLVFFNFLIKNLKKNNFIIMYLKIKK